MKKIFTLALAAVAAVAVSAADLTPGYIVGEIAPLTGTDKDTWAAGGEAAGWNPDAPIEIAQVEEGIYYGEFWLTGYFTFSTSYGDWDTYNADRCWSDSQMLVSDVPSAINFGGEGPGAWTIAKEAAGIAISVKIDFMLEEIIVVNLSEGVVVESSEPAITGFVAASGWNWGVEDPATQVFTKAADGTWVIDYEPALELTEADMLKICGADGKWATVNFGGNGEAIALDTPYELVKGTSDNIVPAAAMSVKSIVLEMSEDLMSATITLKSTSAAIEDIEIDSNEAVEYYNLQGVKVNGELPAGLYIAKQGAKASKVLVK